MKKTYIVTEDLFIAISILLVAMAIIMKIFDASFNFAFTTVGPAQLFTLGKVSLLFSIALNLQDLVRK